MNAYEVREEAARLVAEDRVPTDVLQDIIDTYGDRSPAAQYAEAKAMPGGYFKLEWVGGGVVWQGFADSPVHALDLWADSTEFARYSDIAEDENLGDDERGVIGIKEGLVWGIHTNGWVTVLPARPPQLSEYLVNGIAETVKACLHGDGDNSSDELLGIEIRPTDDDRWVLLCGVQDHAEKCQRTFSTTFDADGGVVESIELH